MQEVLDDAQRRFHVVLGEEKGICENTHTSRTRCCCVYFGAPGQHVTGTCTVTMQCGDEEESCVVCQPDGPPQGNYESVTEALIVANNVDDF